MLKVRLLAFGATIASVAAIGAVFYASSASALYTRAQLDVRLESGFSTALNWDIRNGNGDACKQVTKMGVDNNVTIQTLRNNYINTTYNGNSPASYKSSSWLSSAGTPNTTDPVTLNYGDRNLRLQINDVQFLCGTLVNPDIGTSCSSTRTSTIYNDNRWVTNASPDRRPNPVGGVCLRPALTGLYTQVVRIDVNSTGAFAGTTDFVSGPRSRLEANRDERSRYWFSSPIGFVYRFNNPVTSSGKIELTLHTKKISGYGGVYRCSLTVGGSGNVDNRRDFRRCRTYQSRVSLDIELASSYRLNPSINISTSSGVIDGQRYGVNGAVRNAGETVSRDTKWQVTRMIYAPGVTPVMNRVSNNSVPCDYFSGYKPGSCSIFRSGESNFRLGDTDPIGSGQEVVSEPAGTSLCYATSVNTPTPASRPAWRHSDIKCVVVGKKPLINVIGGDVRAGAGSSSGDIIGTIATIDGNRYGSWAEYGMFAPGQISNFASGGVLSNNLRTPGPSTSPLTFANSPSSGNFQTTMEARGTPVSSIFDKVDQTNRGTWTTLTGTSYTVPSGSGIHRIRSNSTGQITLNGASNISGVVMIDAPNARVVIGGNIIYSNGPFTSTSQIPLVLINAKSIRFVSGVSQVDAGIQTSEEVSTCGAPGATYYEGLKLNSCAQRLQVNGFVSASSLYLRRTAGGDGSTPQQRAVAAETFNLRSDAILKINQMTQGDGISIRTTSITELPPRL